MALTGRITKSTGSWYHIQEESTHRTYEARIRGKFKLTSKRLTNPLAVGDWVDFSLEQDDVAWITKIHDRHNYLIRKSVNLSRQAHIIASNVDVACFLFSLKMPETSLGFLDRFLVCCEAYHIKPIILFNKIDLYSEDEIEAIRDIKTAYEDIGYQCLATSSVTKYRLDELTEMLKDKTSVFFGHSGSGKSTLVNALQPGLDLKTGLISDIHLKGKHTTTFAQMFFWNFGGAVIDTPGVKEFGLIDFETEEVQDFFPEIRSRKQDCKYNNCQHINEPHCAIQKAIVSGDVIENRYQSYLKFRGEVEEENAY